MDERGISLIVILLFLISSAYILHKDKTTGDKPNFTYENKLRFSEASEYVLFRKQMVEELSTRNITDFRLLEAMGSIPRQFFIPESIADNSYTNFPLPIDVNRTTPQPYYVALILESANLNKTSRVLELGTGA